MVPTKLAKMSPPGNNQLIQDVKPDSDMTENRRHSYHTNQPIRFNLSLKALGIYGILGVVQIVIGLVCVISNLIVHLQYCVFMTGIFFNHGTIFGLVFCVTGVIGVVLGSSNNRYLIKLFLVMSILGIFFVPPYMAVFIRAYREIGPFGYNSNYCWFGVNTTLLVMGVAELVVCIITVFIICKRHVRCGQTKQSVTNGDNNYSVPYSMPFSVGDQNGMMHNHDSQKGAVQPSDIPRWCDMK